MSEDAQTNGETTGEAKAGNGGGNGRFTSESAREAGRKSAATRKAGPSTGSQDDAAIIRKLRSKAARGDVAAARELREWQHLDADASTGDDWLGLLTKGERDAVRQLMRHVRARKLDQAQGEWLGVGQALSVEEAGLDGEDAHPHVAHDAPTG